MDTGRRGGRGGRGGGRGEICKDLKPKYFERTRFTIIPGIEASVQRSHSQFSFTDYLVRPSIRYNGEHSQRLLSS